MNYFGSTSPEPSKREIANAALARRAAAESFVLLQNNGTLPLAAKRVALFGMGARKTVAGGEGSGNVTPRYKVSIEQGLEDAGIEVASKAWLDDYDAEYERTYEEYRLMVEEKIADIANPVEQIPVAHTYKYRYPSGRLVNEEDVAASATDTAIYVLMRQAGECADRKCEPGDFLLTEVEKANIRFVAEHYAHSILIVNVGGLVDLSILDEVEVGAVVFYVQGGMEGGHALADVLTGKTNFSGHLADTWPRCYDDVPFGSEFSSLNGNLDNEYYNEGVYVGYRYFDSFGVEPRWPFGFGLSYTSFEQQVVDARVNGGRIEVRVEVKNAGAVAGREVVQVYLHKPDAARPVAQELAAFGKTFLLAPSESQTLELAFDLADCGVYDEKRSAWTLPAGDYLVLVGAHSRAVAPAAVLRLGTEVLLAQCKSCCAVDPERPVNEIVADAAALPAHDLAGVPVIELDSAAFEPRVFDYATPIAVESPKVAAILDRLSTEQTIELVRGGDLQARDPNQHQILGAGGKTAITLGEQGIPNVVFSDGPAGVNIMEEVCYTADSNQTPTHIPEQYNWGLMRKMASRMTSSNGTIVYRYATAWPVEELLAQSWDVDLMEEVGHAAGTELAEFGITLWLAPAMNIHRNPLCGRTFEYYSEDPLVTGRMAAALTRGVQSVPGVGVTVKHFCCNNQEDNRVAVSSNVSEKALREIYLRGFQIFVREAGPWALMTSYNKLNGTYTGEREDLVNGILRSEWGYRGLVMTDWGTRYDPVAALHAGVDMMMPGSDADRDALLAALEAGTLNLAALRTSAARVLSLINV